MSYINEKYTKYAQFESVIEKSQLKYYYDVFSGVESIKPFILSKSAACLY